MNINQISSPQLTFKNFSPATGIASGSRRLASWTLPLTIWYFIKSRPQTEQVEGFITLVTQDQLVILTCKDRRTQHCWQRSAAQHISLSLFTPMCARVSGSPRAGVLTAQHGSSRTAASTCERGAPLQLLCLSFKTRIQLYSTQWPRIRGAPPAPAPQVVESQVHPSTPCCFSVCTWRLEADISCCI